MAVIVDVTPPQVLPPPVHSGIPPELSDRVIDFLHDERDALKACSLTCKAWLPASRFQLWNRVVLRYSADGTDYAEFLKGSPAITSCIVDLTVEFPTDRNNEHSKAAEAKWMTETLIPIFSTLRILQQLTFVGAVFGEDAFLASIYPNLSTAKVVHLLTCHFSNFSPFVELVWSCPLLENLRIDTITFDQVDAYTPRPPSVPRPELKFLVIIYYSSVHMPVVIDWLVSEGFCTHVGFLVVFQQHIECPAITRLLPAVGSNLRHLSVSYALLPSAPDSKDGNADLFPTISHCTDLQTLNFLFAGIGTFPWIPLVISQISSPHVEEIDLGITDIFTPDDFNRFDWSSLWNALTQTRFVKLKSVRLMVAAGSRQSSKETKECIAHHLKQIDTRGLISIHVECSI